MTADPVKKLVLYWYEKLQIEAWARVKKARPKSVPSDTTFENQRRTKWYAFGPKRHSVRRSDMSEAEVKADLEINGGLLQIVRVKTLGEPPIHRNRVCCRLP